MNQPFDGDVMDEMDGGQDALDEMEQSADGLEEGDDFADAMSDEFDAAGDDFSGELSGDEFSDGFEDAPNTGGALAAFEEELADGLDAADTDEFLSRILGGLGRAAGMLGRSGSRAAQAGRRAQPIARGVGQAATGVSNISSAAAQLARAMGSQTWGRRLDTVGNVAGRVGGAAQNIAGLLGNIFGQGFDEFDAFDYLADAYEDGIDEALPGMVGLAARAAARGLGFGGLTQLSQAGRRALVSGISTAARELMRSRQPGAIRALPRLARSTTRTLRRRNVSPQQVAQTVRRTMPRTARRVAQNPQVLRRVAQPGAASRVRPLARPTDLGHGRRTRTIPRGTIRTFRINGPVELAITAR
ncbi:MAG: hypothetical protein LZF61_03610 [Nitrosomonas sp.]|nr:MAG: hypothetical protein LZF61_03610 [Nitrosomonas sp.]